MGLDEVPALAGMERSVKYHPGEFGVLTLIGHPGQGHCMVGSLTGAVSSQRVTEECEGWLSAVGNRALECIGISQPDCETNKSSRVERRSK